MPFTCKRVQLNIYSRNMTTVHQVYPAEKDTHGIYMGSLFRLALEHTFRPVADEFTAMDVCLHLAMTELVAAGRSLIGVHPSWQLHPVASHHFVIDHEAQCKEHVAFVCCEAA